MYHPVGDVGFKSSYQQREEAGHWGRRQLGQDMEVRSDLSLVLGQTSCLLDVVK